MATTTITTTVIQFVKEAMPAIRSMMPQMGRVWTERTMKRRRRRRRRTKKKRRTKKRREQARARVTEHLGEAGPDPVINIAPNEVILIEVIHIGVIHIEVMHIEVIHIEVIHIEVIHIEATLGGTNILGVMAVTFIGTAARAHLQKNEKRHPPRGPKVREVVPGIPIDTNTSAGVAGMVPEGFPPRPLPRRKLPQKRRRRSLPGSGTAFSGWSAHPPLLRP
jgi:hypothetical protein